MAANLRTAIKVATINVRGLSSKRRQYQLNRLFLEDDINVIAVQETKIESQEQTDRMVQTFRTRYNVCVSHSVGASAGCALFLRNSVGIVEESVSVCDSGRFIVCDFLCSEMSWRVICVYAPNKKVDRRCFFESLKVYLNCERHVIFLGDFNCVCSTADRANKVPTRDESAMVLNSLVQEYGLEDVACFLSNLKVPQYTHFQRESHARLDRAYVSLSLVPMCESYSVKPVSFSDHSIVMFTIGKKQTKTRFNWDTWKLNVKLLGDEQFTSGVKRRLEQVFETESGSVIAVWEQLKSDVKISAIERSCMLRHIEKEKEKELHSQLHFLLGAESKQPGTFTKQIREVKNKLEVIDIEKYRGAIVRARAERLWLGETPSKRSLSDEKGFAQKNEIKAIRYKNEVSNDSEVVERAFFEHYKELLGCAKQGSTEFEEIFLPLMPKLSDDAKVSIEAPVSVQEIKNAIDDLTTGKSPGPDGLGAEFYKFFKEDIAVILHSVIMEAYEFKRTPPTFRKSHIVLIPKTDDPEKLLAVESYRPISLTNVDYKIFMKVLARRLQGVIKNIVGPHQTCGIQGRSIFTNIHVARSVLECCDALGGRVAMMQIDLHKAFDRVVHEILFSVLEYVNVGSIILEGVKMSYNQCSASVIVNKKVGESFEIMSYVRQGCPLSPLLFAIYLEPFCLKILNGNIGGFRLHSSEVKILAYADDIAVFCTDKKSVSEVVKDVKQFCKLSGSAVNWNKCIGFWHGDWQSKPVHFENVPWTTTPARYLGIPLENYQDAREYWDEETEKVREKITKWRWSGSFNICSCISV